MNAFRLNPQIEKKIRKVEFEVGEALSRFVEDVRKQFGATNEALTLVGVGLHLITVCTVSKVARNLSVIGKDRRGVEFLDEELQRVIREEILKREESDEH